jgi:predicted GTPase
MPVDNSFVGHFLRGRALAALVFYAVPMLALMVLGLVWLGERGWLLWFVGGCFVLIGGFRLVALVLHRLARARARARAEGEPAPPAAAVPGVEANPEWNAQEVAVFRQLLAGIAADVAEPVPWSELQPLALGIVETAAGSLSGGERKALDFSVPEALLLCDRVITRLRMDMRRYVPFADTVSIDTLLWAWSNREWFQRGAWVAQGLWRVRRAITNPPAAILQEVQGLLLGDSAGILRSTGIVGVQRMLLAEVARAAIDLHSGHLRFSDAELLEMELASQRTDAATRRPDDTPLRVVVVGQVSAGKTSLINALAGEDLGETDAAPTTEGLVSHALDFGAVGFTFVDTEGIDGSEAVLARLLEQLLQADMILGVVRGTRPARAPDLALLARLRAEFAQRKMRRAPRIVVAVTAVDQLIEGWPYPENLLPESALSRLGGILKAVRDDLGEELVLPVSTRSPEWNIAQLATLLAQGAGEALMVQRNRRRIEGDSTLRGARADAGRTVRGLRQLGLLAMRSLRR